MKPGNHQVYLKRCQFLLSASLEDKTKSIQIASLSSGEVFLLDFFNKLERW